MGNQGFKALIFHDDIGKAVRGFFQLPEGCPNAEGLTGKAPAGTGIAVAHALEKGCRLEDFFVVRPVVQCLFHLLCPLLHREQVVNDHILRGKKEDGIPSACVEFEPFPELRPGVQGQQSQLQQEFGRSVPDTAKQVHQFIVQVIVDLELVLRLSQQHGSGAAKGFYIAVVFRREYGENNRQQIGFVADAGKRCSNRLSASIHNGNGRYSACGQAAVSAIQGFSGHFHYKNGAAPILKSTSVFQMHHLPSEISKILFGLLPSYWTYSMVILIRSLAEQGFRKSQDLFFHLFHGIISPNAYRKRRDSK